MKTTANKFVGSLNVLLKRKKGKVLLTSGVYYSLFFFFQQAQFWALFFCVRNRSQRTLQVSSAYVLELKMALKCK